jgi:tetratricopeptide (TPR) repeat protein
MWIKVKSLAQKAIEIDEMEPQTQMIIGTIKAQYEYDWKGAEIHYKRAIELNPSSIDEHIGYGLHLIGVGRVYEAIEEMKHGLEVDPFSISANSVLCIAYYSAREFDEAIAQVKKALELSPNDTVSLMVLALCYAGKGMYEEGISILQKLPNIPLYATFLGYIYSKAGKKEETQRILDEILERSKHEYIQPNLIAALYGNLGDKDKAFEWLERGFEDHDSQNWCIKVEPMFDDLRSDPRWTDLMKKMNLAD